MLTESRPGIPLTPQAILGAVIVIYGLILTADNLGWIEGGSIFSYWPLALAALGATMLGRAMDGSSRLIAILVTGAGVLLTVARVFGYPVRLSVLWPLLLIAIGVRLVLRSQGGGSQTPQSEEQLSGLAFWSGTKRRVTSQFFKRADFTVVMGGVEADLRSATIVGGEAVIDLFVVMGPVEILVPPDWTVVNQLVAVMSGVDDKSTGEPSGKNRLVLRGFVLMGSVEVK